MIRAADFDPATRGDDRLAGGADRARDRRRLDARRQPAAEGHRRQEVPALDADRDRRSRRRRRPARRARLPVPRSARQGRRPAVPARRRPRPRSPRCRSRRRPTIDAAVVGDEAVRATAVANVLGGRLAWEAVFRDLSRVLPANVWLSTLSLTAPAAANLADGTTAAPAPTRGRRSAGADGVTIDGYTYTQPDVARLLARLATLPSLKRVTLTSSQSRADRNQEGRPLRHRRRPEPDRRCVMSALLQLAEGQDRCGRGRRRWSSSSPLWFLLVSPQRAKATELQRRLADVARRSSSSAGPRSRRPSANVTVRAERPLPADEGAAGRHEHVGHPARRQPDRGAEQADVHLDHAGRRRSSEPATCSSRSTSSCRAASATSRASSVTSARSSRSAASGSTPAVVSTRCRASASPHPKPGQVPDRQGHGDAERLRLQRPGADDARPGPVHLYRHVLRRDGRGRSDPLMAKRSAQDTAAAKAKKQKMILIVGGVLLLAVAAFQGPKLMKQRRVGRRSAASAAAPMPDQADTRARGAVDSRSAPRAPRSSQASPCRGSAAVKAETSQLALVHALRGQGSVRPAGRRRSRLPPRRTSGRPAPPADRTGRAHGLGRLHRLGATPGPATPPRRPRTDHLRDDRLQRRSRSSCR